MAVRKYEVDIERLVTLIYRVEIDIPDNISDDEIDEFVTNKLDKTYIDELPHPDGVSVSEPEEDFISENYDFIGIKEE